MNMASEGLNSNNDFCEDTLKLENYKDIVKVI